MEKPKEAKNKRYNGEISIPPMTGKLANWITGKFLNKEYLECPELVEKCGECCSWWNFSTTSNAIYINGVEIYNSGVWRFVVPAKWISELVEIMKVEEEQLLETGEEVVIFDRQLTE